MGRDKYQAKRMRRDCKREKKGKNWDKLSFKPKQEKDWDKTVSERREEKNTGTRQILSQKNGARL